MEFPALKDAQGKLDAKRADLAKIMGEAKLENGTYDMDKIKSVSGSKDDKLSHIRKANEELADLKKEVDKHTQLKRAAEFSAEGSQSGADNDDQGARPEFKSFGKLFTESKAFKERGQTSHLDIDLKVFNRSGTSTGGWPPESTRSGLVTLSPQIPAPSVTDHLPTITVNQASYKYMEETTYTNAAAETDESGLYAEAALALTERSLPVQKLAVWLSMTDEQLEDEPAAAEYVNARLANMIRQKLDLQALIGSGTGTPTQILGTTAVSGIQTQAAGQGNSAGAGFSLLDDSYKLFTSIRTDGFAEPSVAFVRPTYWQGVALLKTADGIYIYGSPTSGAPSVLWGVPVVQTMAAPSTKLVAGDYANYGFLGVRRGLDVQITNSHASQFINGQQAVRADMRVVLVHVRPKAFGVVTGLS